MSSVFIRRTYLKARNNLLSSGNTHKLLPSCIVTISPRMFSDDKIGINNPQFSSSTIFVENGLNVHELPVIVRKLQNLSDIDYKPVDEPTKCSQESNNYHLIQEEFKLCSDLREVFSLLSKCTKITPNIALGAIERIYDLEKNPNVLNNNLVDSNNSIHINLAKGAILDKLLKVVMKTEDTDTILNILSTVSSFMEPYKHKFSNELLLRVVDNKLFIDQLCEFINFLIINKSDSKYSEIIDKLWVGFVEKEADINEKNIVKIFTILHGLKASKRPILTLLEDKFSDLWSKINDSDMQEILNIFIQEKYVSLQSFAVVGHWLNNNIHALDEDSLLDIISKLTRLNYTDDQIERAVEKYMKLKGTKISTHVLIVGILNFCMQFQIRNKQVLQACSEYFLSNTSSIPPSFIKSFMYPFGYLYYRPVSVEFWELAENNLNEKFDKITADDLCSIILAYIYVGKYPLSIISRIFCAQYLVKVNPETMKKLYLIDTALSLECQEYSGPLLPKDQWYKPISQDHRIKNIIKKSLDSFIHVAGGDNKLSTAVLVPNLCSNETYLIDVMLHPAGMGSNTYNWKTKSLKNENIAILVHLPDHYCSNNDQLIGPQMMKEKHLKILGMKVVSLKYSILSQFYTSCNMAGLRQYLSDSINNAEPCL